MSGYIYDVSPDMSSVYVSERMHQSTPIPKDDKSILDSDPEENNIDTQPESILAENLNYDPNFSDIGSPIAPSNVTNSDEPQIEDDVDTKSIFHDIDDKSAEDIVFDKGAEEDDIITKDSFNYVPSAVVDYYNETTLKAAARNKLDDDQFGLPRLRKYPLNDRRHVAQAIRMFSHCKDPKDRKILANNIIKRYNELGMTTKVGKNNPLYEYVPETMQETALVSESGVYFMGKVVKRRTREDVIKDHLKNNAVLYNTLFYDDSYVRTMKGTEMFEFLNYFYPSFKLHNFYTRMRTSIGGLAMNEQFTEQLNIPTIMKLSNDYDLNNVKDISFDNNDDSIANFAYDHTINWFGEEAKDMEHIEYCIKLYFIVHTMLYNKAFTVESIPPYCNGILMDWETKVNYYYGLMQDATEYSKEYFKYCQYLHDLMWDPIDDPKNAGAVSANIISFIRQMNNDLLDNINESGLLTRDSMSAYLSHELGLEDDNFLLPSSLEYPVIDKDSVKFAMDNIQRIPNDQIQEYVVNLNRKYVELNCDFSINVDHPYAKYASDAIVDHMNRTISESDTVVKDDAPNDDNVDDDGSPWYKTVNYNFYASSELGPSDSKETEKTTIERMSGAE